MIGREAALKILKRVVGRSRADQTEALLLTEDSSLTRFTPEAVHQHVAERNRTLILRVALGKRLAAVHTNLLGPADLSISLERALSLARVRPPHEDFRSLAEGKPLPEVNTFSPAIGRLTPLRKVQEIKRIRNLLKGRGVRGSGAFSHGTVEVAVVNSLGVEAYQLYSDLFFHLIVDDGKSSGYASFVGRDPERFDSGELARAALARLSGKETAVLEPGEYEVILEPYAVAELLAFLGYLGFHALAVQEGRSFLCGQFGRKMVHEKVTVYDDGLDPAGLQVPFDFEGQPKRRVTFFEEGVARAATYDSFTAGREGRTSTGHALLPPNSEGPIPINLFMREGDSSLPEMIRSVRRGIYVTRFHYTNVVEPVKAVITGMTRDGTFLIEGGEIQRPVKNLRFTESILKALSRVKAVSRERKVCSEGTVYSRRFITGIVAPALQIEGFNFSGLSL
ncbi:MAG: TldD/PmbA family protein [Deltaproteobacteria bacterium]|nr:TldD/PmbA family protein [Deltaproteobacteria bacterium]